MEGNIRGGIHHFFRVDRTNIKQTIQALSLRISSMSILQSNLNRCQTKFHEARVRINDVLHVLFSRRIKVRLQ